MKEKRGRRAGRQQQQKSRRHPKYSQIGSEFVLRLSCSKFDAVAAVVVVLSCNSLSQVVLYDVP